MGFYVSNNAFEELNICEKTKILDENGNETGGYICIRNSGPVIHNIFGCFETIWLDKLELYEDGLRGWLTTHDCTHFINFHFYNFHLYNGDRITSWFYTGDE